MSDNPTIEELLGVAAEALVAIVAVIISSAFMARYPDATTIAAVCGLLALAGYIVIVKQPPNAEALPTFEGVAEEDDA